MIIQTDKKIVLASASPRRKTLIKYLFSDYEVVPSSINEDNYKMLSPLEMSEFLATQKTKDIAKYYPDAIVIGCDTSVVLGERILGKPKDEAQARNMLYLIRHIRLLQAYALPTVTHQCLFRFLLMLHFMN